MPNLRETKYISVNALPAYMKVMLLGFMFTGCLLVGRTLDTDFYFLYSFGRYIASNGFPVKDVLSMHSDMNIIVQQWLTDVMFYHTYEVFGKVGMLVIVYAMQIVYTILMYKLCKLVTDNFFLSVTVTSVSAILVSVQFMVTRPQIFTYVIFILLLYFQEKYVRTGKVRWLCLLPVLSVLQINLHASMWLMLFVLMMPYVVSCVPINLPFYKEPARCKLRDLALTMAAMVAVAFINPYGYKSLLYLFGSYGIDIVNVSISEMQPVSISEASGVLFIGILFFMGFLMCVCGRRKPELRFLCLALGTAVLGLSSYKANVYFYIAGFVSFAHYFRNFDFTLKQTEGKRTRKEKIRLIVLIVLVVLALGLLLIQKSEAEPVGSEWCEKELGPVVSYLDTQDREGMVLYAGFNEGAYLEFHGYKPYLDARAEVFLEAKNGQFDYFTEAAKVRAGCIFYKDFLEKYDFTHILVPTGDNYLYLSISHDADYTTGYSDENYTVFIKNDIA